MLLQPVNHASKSWCVQGKNLTKQNVASQFEQEKYKTKIKAITYQVSSEECTASGSLHGILFQMIADKNAV